jgi:hypothetical protein
MSPGGYFDDMKSESLASLNAEVQKHADAIAPLVVQP